MEQFIHNFSQMILAPAATLIALLAFALFVWGVVQFIGNAENQEKRATGQKHMIWGIIGLAILFGANAIVNLIGSIVGL